jgi:hypothetical protein
MEERPAIEPMFEVLYLEQIKYEAERANAAFERFDTELALGNYQGLVVANVQDALTHIGELSRIFWPARDNGISIARGEQLRIAFGLDESSPLKERDLRNALEHFDERLDSYLANSPAGQLITDPIVAPVEAISEPMRIFRMVDPVSSTFVVLDERYEFGLLREVTREIEKRAEEMIKNGGRLSH